MVNFLKQYLLRRADKIISIVRELTFYISLKATVSSR